MNNYGDTNDGVYHDVKRDQMKIHTHKQDQAKTCMSVAPVSHSQLTFSNRTTNRLKVNNRTIGYTKRYNRPCFEKTKE